MHTNAHQSLHPYIQKYLDPNDYSHPAAERIDRLFVKLTTNKRYLGGGCFVHDPIRISMKLACSLSSLRYNVETANTIILQEKINAARGLPIDKERHQAAENYLENLASDMQRILDDAKQQYSQRPWWQRLFGFNPAEHDLCNTLTRVYCDTEQERAENALKGIVQAIAAQGAQNFVTGISASAIEAALKNGTSEEKSEALRLCTEAIRSRLDR